MTLSGSIVDYVPHCVCIFLGDARTNERCLHRVWEQKPTPGQGLPIGILHMSSNDFMLAFDGCADEPWSGEHTADEEGNPHKYHQSEKRANWKVWQKSATDRGHQCERG